MEEKRVKLGVDIGKLSQELLQVNNLVEENYRKSLQGQTAYNSILEESIRLLTKEAELVKQLGGSLQNTTLGSRGGEGGGSNSPVHVVVDNVPIQVELNKGGFSGGGSSGDMSPSEIKRLLVLIDAARGTGIDSNEIQENALDNETESRENDLLKDIKEDLDQIWEKLSEGITAPIPVEIKNVPLDVNNSGGSTEGEGSSEDNEGGGNGGNGAKGKGNRGANAFNQAAGLVQQDPNYALAGALNLIPYVGVGLGMIASKLIQEAEQYDTAIHKLRAARGMAGGYGSFTDIGLKDAESFEKLAAYYPANINLKRSDLLFEKGFNISSGTLDSLLRAFREDIARQAGASVVGVSYLQGLSNRGGIGWNEVRGYSEDYLKILVELNQKQLEATGETNSLINSHIIQGIASLSNKFGDPTILSRVVGSIQGGLQQAKNPQIEALQYYALAQANPGASIWEMQLMKEDPFGRGRGYFSKYMESLLSTGNIQDVKFNVMNAFGLGARQTEELIEGIQNARRRAESGEESYQKYLTNGRFDLSKYFETADFGSVSVETRRSQRSLSSAVDNRPIYEVLPQLLREAGLDIKVSSGYRKAGAVGTAGDRSWHPRHGAVDIVPQGNTTYEDIEQAIYNNPKIYEYLLANGFGLLDESGRSAASRGLMKKTGATGAHFHFGKDTSARTAYEAEMKRRGITKDSFSEYIESITGGWAGSAADLINREAAAGTSDVQRQIATASNYMAAAGEPLLEVTTTIANFVGSVGSKMPDYMDTASRFMGDFWGEMKNALKEAFKDALPQWLGGNPPKANNTNPQQQGGTPTSWTRITAD